MAIDPCDTAGCDGNALCTVVDGAAKCSCLASYVGDGMTDVPSMALTKKSGGHTVAVYDRKRSMQAYARRAYPLYRQTHVQRAMAMVLKAIGLQPQGWLNSLLTRIGLWFLSRNAAKLAQQGA